METLAIPSTGKFYEQMMDASLRSEDQQAESGNESLMEKLLYLPFIFASISSAMLWSWFICLTTGRSIQIK